MEDDLDLSSVRVIHGVIDELGQRVLSDTSDVLRKIPELRSPGRCVLPDPIFSQALQWILQTKKRLSRPAIPGASTLTEPLKPALADKGGQMTMGRLARDPRLAGQFTGPQVALFGKNCVYDLDDFRPPEPHNSKYY